MMEKPKELRFDCISDQGRIHPFHASMQHRTRTGFWRHIGGG